MPRISGTNAAQSAAGTPSGYDFSETALERDRKRFESVEVPGVPVASRAIQAEVRQPLEQDAESGLHFEAGQGGTDTEMDAGAEGHVGIRRTGGFESIRLRKFGFIAVGGTQEQADLFALFQRHAAIFDVLEGVALEHVERSIETQHLFGAGGRAGQKMSSPRVAEEGQDAIAEGVDGGFVAGVEEEDGGGDEFVVGERSAFFVASGEELGEEVVGGLAASVGEVGTHVLTEGEGGGDGAVFHGAVAAGLIHGDHVVGPREDLRGHVGGHAEKAGDDHDGNGLGEGFYQVGAAGGLELVDEVVGELFDLWTQAFDLAGEEGRVDKTAEAGVDGRFEFEEGVFFELVEWGEVRWLLGPAEFFGGGEVEDLASETSVAEEGADILVAGEAPEVVEVGPAEDGGAGAPLGVIGVRVLDELRVARVQGDAAIHGEEVVSGLRGAQCGLIRLRDPVHGWPVRVMFFAQLREVTGVEVAEIEADGLDGAGLWEMLVKLWPGLAVHRTGVRLARNGVYAEVDEIFSEQDEVALIPPVSGG